MTMVVHEVDHHRRLKPHVQHDLLVRLQGEGEADQRGAGVGDVGLVQILHAIDIRRCGVVGRGPAVRGEDGRVRLAGFRGVRGKTREVGGQEFGRQIASMGTALQQDGGFGGPVRQRGFGLGGHRRPSKSTSRR